MRWFILTDAVRFESYSGRFCKLIALYESDLLLNPTN